MSEELKELLDDVEQVRLERHEPPQLLRPTKSDAEAVAVRGTDTGVAPEKGTK